ncbi:hypothetical protein GOODEAATRI_025952 [Goodea atripinnis]|uniref:Uncharacterized protein n=1 Tax=Goodea atripinnis TaxID=208336 RepID=A0ABV0NNB8_9TELE
MDGSHCCMDCGAALQADDGHDLCPTCLGRDHLVEPLSENSCMNCSFMPHMLRVARLPQLSPQDDADLPPSGQVAPLRRSKRRGLCPPLGGSGDEEEVQSSQASETSSFSLQSGVGKPSDGSIREVMCMALRQLQLELLLGEESASGSAFFQARTCSYLLFCPSVRAVPKGVHACWRDTRALSCLSTDGRVPAAMQESVKAGLDHMPVVEPAVASLIVSPDEALGPDVRCPRTQCWDDLLCKVYNAGARAGRLGNSMAHLMFALSASLQDTGGATVAVGFSDAALRTFALMTRELGRVMSFRRQVWLAQSPLTEACRIFWSGPLLICIPYEQCIYQGSANRSWTLSLAGPLLRESGPFIAMWCVMGMCLFTSSKATIAVSWKQQEWSPSAASFRTRWLGHELPQKRAKNTLFNHQFHNIPRRSQLHILTRHLETKQIPN